MAVTAAVLYGCSGSCTRGSNSSGCSSSDFVLAVTVALGVTLILVVLILLLLLLLQMVVVVVVMLLLEMMI